MNYNTNISNIEINTVYEYVKPRYFIIGIYENSKSGSFINLKDVISHPKTTSCLIYIWEDDSSANKNEFNKTKSETKLLFKTNENLLSDKLNNWTFEFNNYFTKTGHSYDYTNQIYISDYESFDICVIDKYGEEKRMRFYQDKNSLYSSIKKLSDFLKIIAKINCWYDYEERNEKIKKINEINIDDPVKEIIIKSNSKTPTIEALNTMIGLSSVKKDVSELVNLIKIREIRKKESLPITPTSLHLVFTGNPGTGKTTVARIIGQIYKEISVLEKGHFVEADRAKLVGEYVGHTAVKTTKLFNEAIGGVLFIDEAYTLSKGSENDFGKEAIDCLLKLMEDNREKIVVIIAGYTNEINQFLDSNPGLRSRFPKYIHFEDYLSEELLNICLVYFSSYKFILDESANVQLKSVLDEISQNENFGNGRGCRNLVEKIITCQANRIAQIENLNKIDLTTIKKEDIDNAYKIEDNDN